MPLDPAAVKREAVYLLGGPLVKAKISDFFIAEQIDKLGEMACEDVEAKMDEDCCQQTLRRLENSILEDCGIRRSDRLSPSE